MAARKALEMSATCTSGRHGVPSDCSRTSPRVKAVPVRLFTTMSARRRGDDPYAVAFRRKVGLNPSSARLGQALLGQHLALAVRGHRIELRGLVDRSISCRTVEGAGRGEQESWDSGSLGRLRCRDRAHGVDRARRLGVQVSDRIVGDRSQVHHRIESLERRRVQVSHITHALLVAGDLWAEVTTGVPAHVQADDVMACGEEHRNENSPDVPPVSCHQHAQRTLPSSRLSSHRVTENGRFPLIPHLGRRGRVNLTADAAWTARLGWEIPFWTASMSSGCA